MPGCSDETPVERDLRLSRIVFSRHSSSLQFRMRYHKVKQIKYYLIFCRSAEYVFLENMVNPKEVVIIHMTSER